MERSARPQRTLSKQAEFDEDDEITSALVSPKDKSDLNNDNTPVDQVTTNNNNIHRSRSQSKVKLLVRSHAMREETSPPPDPVESCSPTPTTTIVQQTNNNSNHNNNINNNNNNNLTVSRQSRLRRDGSSQGSIDSNSWSPCISRGSSTEQYTDSTGVDLEQFIAETLNRNQKDRMLLLKIEHDLVSLAKDSKRNVHKFPPMSSYQRMLVHRAAAYFGMEHNVDPSGHSVVVNTTKATRIPDSRFKQHLRDDLLFPEEPRRSILKRDSSSFEETGSFKSAENGDSRRSKSFEEREEEYEKARRRIFNRDDDGSLEELAWSPEGTWNGSDIENSNRLRTNCSDRPPGRLLKVESYESKDTLRANSLRLTVSKSYSFGGYDQSQPASRILVKQDSGSSMSSRLSPSSSGYKSQSQRSDTTLSATPSPSATPHPHMNQLSSQSGDGDPDTNSEPTVVWAVTNIASVPAGSVLINPQTGQPYTNSDGSIYHFDPENPPKVESAPGSSETILLPPPPQSPPTLPPVTPPPQPPPLPPSSLSTTPSTSCASQRAISSHSPVKREEYGTATSQIPPLPMSSHNSNNNNNNVNNNNNNNSSNNNNSCSNNNLNNSNPTRETEKLIIHPMPHSQQSAAILPAQPPPPVPIAAPAPVPAPPPPPPPPAHPPAPIPYNHPHYPPPAPMYPYPGAPSYNLVLQHAENQMPAGQQPPALMYTPAAPSTAPYDHRIPISDATELSYNMMGLNIADGSGGRNTGAAAVDSRAGPPLVYWPHQLPQVQGQTHSGSMPVYYAPSGQNSTPRYQAAAPAPVVPPPYQPISQPERSVGYNGNDCSLAYPQSTLHMFYNSQCNNGSPPTSQGGSAWGNGGNGPPLVTLQYPAAPTPPQTLCTQYTVYSNGYGVGVGGCYQSHYPNSSNPPQPPLTLPPIFRPPNIQMSRNPGARTSPGMKERNDLNPHIPMFGLRVMPGNTNRLPFSLPANGNKPAPNHHIRKQRPNSGRPMIIASQQPTPFAVQPSTVPGYLMSTVAP